MSEQYLFIIWNKALFCKNRILNDLSKSFKIDKHFYVQWPKELFAKNIKAFYGIKTNNIEEKIKHIGNGKFLVIIATDSNPIYDYRKTYNGQEKVNIKTYDCKRLYRKWTAGQFRIHSTQNEIETKHDLTVLFGCEYEKTINVIDNESVQTINTIGAYSFTSLDDFGTTISNISDSRIFTANNTIAIFTICRKDIESLLFFSKNVDINNKEYILKIYGEKDNDIPINFVTKINENIYKDFVEIEDDYQFFLKTNIVNSNKLKNFLCKYGVDLNIKQKNPTRPYFKTSMIRKSINYVKYLLCVIKYRD